jgi:hypothetical protein
MSWSQELSTLRTNSDQYRANNKSLKVKGETAVDYSEKKAYLQVELATECSAGRVRKARC